MRPWLGWLAVTALVLSFVLIPFALWDEAVQTWSARLLTPTAGRSAVISLVVVLLTADVVLPIPSSFVSAGAVALLGAVEGGAAVALGMTAASWLGYGLGRVGGQPLVRKLAGAVQLTRAERMMRRYGSWMLLVCRGVPVLAEASALLAGATRLPALRFGVVTTLANLGLACAYAAIALLELSGVLALLAPFAFGLLVPGVALALLRPLASG
jgi:membrane protein DedA with SNARE-associated domain